MVKPRWARDASATTPVSEGQDTPTEVDVQSEVSSEETVEPTADPAEPEDSDPDSDDSDPDGGVDPRLELVELFQHTVLADPHQAKSIYILGKRGYGKTYDTNELAKLFMAHGWRVHTVCPVSTQISGHKQYTPLGHSQGTMLDAAYVGCLEDVKQGHRACMVIDEVDQFCGPYSMEDVVKDVINYGRHLKIWLICNSRRPARVNRDITSLMDCVVVHYISSGNEYNYVEDITEDRFRLRIEEAFLDFEEKCDEDPSYKYHREIWSG